MDAPLKQLEGTETRVMAPEDCTQAARLRGLVGEVRRGWQPTPGTVIVDLSRVRRMNARLLATILLLVRESTRVGSTLRLQGVPDEFRRWAGIFHVLGPLEKRGIIGGDSAPV